MFLLVKILNEHALLEENVETLKSIGYQILDRDVHGKETETELVVQTKTT